MGELSLNGEVKPVRGALPTALSLKNNGYLGLLLPEANAYEAAVVEGIEVVPVKTLGEVVEFLTGATVLPLLRRS